MVDDIIAPNLSVVFVGYNPSLKTAQTGHHFAGPGNLFWALLADSELTPHRLLPEQDRLLLVWKLGIINLVDRPTAGSSDLSRAEMANGVNALECKLKKWQPDVACFLGKDIFRQYQKLPTSRSIAWGLQEPSSSRPLHFVAPNPSRRSTVAYGLRLRYFRELKNLAFWGVNPRPS